MPFLCVAEPPDPLLASLSPGASPSPVSPSEVKVLLTPWESNEAAWSLSVASRARKGQPALALGMAGSLKRASSLHLQSLTRPPQDVQKYLPTGLVNLHPGHCTEGP